jgi:hypothetical protein
MGTLAYMVAPSASANLLSFLHLDQVDGNFSNLVVSFLSFW